MNKALAFGMALAGMAFPNAFEDLGMKNNPRDRFKRARVRRFKSKRSIPREKRVAKRKLQREARRVTRAAI